MATKKEIKEAVDYWNLQSDEVKFRIILLFQLVENVRKGYYMKRCRATIEIDEGMVYYLISSHKSLEPLDESFENSLVR